MTDHDETTLGVLGGMGPQATASFMSAVIDRTPASRDQDHVPMVVYNDPTVPDRSAAILEDGDDPVPQLRENARELERAGADLVAVPCNTFHYFYESVRPAVDVPVLHMIRETADVLVDRGVDEVGLLATEGTLRTGVYHDVLEEYGVAVREPADTDAVMDAIYRIKAGEHDRPRAALESACDAFVADGVSAVVAGCTEIPLVLDERPALVDPMAVLADACVREVKESDRATARTAPDGV